MKIQYFLALFLLTILGVDAQTTTPYPFSLYYQYVNSDITAINYVFVPIPPDGADGILVYDGQDTLPHLCVFGDGLVYDALTHSLSVDYSNISGKPTLGTASAQNISYFATSSQGTKADSSLQSTDIGTNVQAYSSNLGAFATNGSSYYLSRSNATGTQAASTISDFSTAAVSAVTWSTLTGKPTTLAGYGITDPVVLTSGSYSNPSWISALDYSKLTGAPSLATVATTGAYSDLTGKPSLATVATSGSYNDLANKPSIPTVQAYEGTTQRLNSFPIFKSVTVASGVAIFNLTNDGTSTGTALFPNGVITDSVNVTVSDATASYQMSWAFSNSNKTLTVTANKLTTANILTGILGQSSANGAVVKLQAWGY